MITVNECKTERTDSETDMKSSFALERADHELGGTGLLTRDLQLSGCAFPPFYGQWLVQSRKRSLTVAGQWRIFTALPEHLASVLLY
jgi:hypothetical protein